MQNSKEKLQTSLAKEPIFSRGFTGLEFLLENAVLLKIPPLFKFGEEYYLLTIEVYDWNYQIFEKLFDILQTLLRFLYSNVKHEIVSTELRVD